MSFFKFSSTDKKGNREVRFGYVDGIQDLFDVPKETVDVTIDKDAGKLSIKSAIVKNRIANLDLIKN